MKAHWIVAVSAVASAGAAIAAAVFVRRAHVASAARLLSLEALVKQTHHDCGVATERLTGRVDVLEHLEQERQQQDREDDIG